MPRPKAKKPRARTSKAPEAVAEPAVQYGKSILDRAGALSRHAQEELFALLYDTLRGYARSMMMRQRRDHTLQPTALVHEAYAKLFGRQRTWSSRAHFLGTIVKAMQSLLKDHARGVTRQKRGRDKRVGGADPDTVETSAGRARISMSEWIEIAQVIEEMATTDPAAAEIAQFRLFGGFDLPEIAELLKMKLRTVERKWAWACAVLRRKLE